MPCTPAPLEPPAGGLHLLLFVPGTSTVLCARPCAAGAGPGAGGRGEGAAGAGGVQAGARRGRGGAASEARGRGGRRARACSACTNPAGARAVATGGGGHGGAWDVTCLDGAEAAMYAPKVACLLPLLVDLFPVPLSQVDTQGSCINPKVLTTPRAAFPATPQRQHHCCRPPSLPALTRTLVHKQATDSVALVHSLRLSATFQCRLCVAHALQNEGSELI